MLKKILFSSLIFISFNAFATNGNQLYASGIEYKKLNTTRSLYDDGFFSGYVLGISEDIKGVCYTKGVKNIQAIDVVFNYLERHPEIRNKDATYLVKEALREAWPCKN